MATADSSASGFKKETIAFVISTIQHIWAKQSPEKLEAVFDYLKSIGVKSEANVGAINEVALVKLIGAKAASIILEHLSEPKGNEKAEEPGNGNFQPGPEGGNNGSKVPSGESGSAADSERQRQLADGPISMKEMMQFFTNMQACEAQKNRDMMLQMQEGMQKTIVEVTNKIMTTVTEINNKLTDQMELQRQLLDKLGGQMVAIEERHEKTTRETQEWMASTQKMNNQVLVELTKKVNAALEGIEDVKNKPKAASPSTSSKPKGSCNLL